MLTDFAATGNHELWNMRRLSAYLENVGSPFTTGSAVCGCDTLTAEMLDDPGGYSTPTLDPAPWYDVDQPESADFLGFMPLSVTGLDDNPRARNVTGAVGGGGVFGPVRALPRTIVVTGLLVGASCCGAEYGIHYLSEALAGCSGSSCEGDCLEMFNCCPDASSTRAAFLAAHRRTFRGTSLVSGPTVTERNGTGTCARGSCGVNGDIITVEFTLVSTSPWAWTDPVEVLNVALPIGGSGDCIEWCLSSGPGLDLDLTGNRCVGGECQHAPCKSAVDKCADPNRVVPAPPVPAAPEASFCIPLASERACYTIDLSSRPGWSSDVPVFTLRAGSKELRNVRIAFYEKPTGTTQTCDQIADASRCAAQNDFVVTYIPKNGSVTIDGQTGRATTECEGDCKTASTVFGSTDGGPVQIQEMTCAQFCVCIETDPAFPPAADANLSLSISGRTY